MRELIKKFCRNPRKAIIYAFTHPLFVIHNILCDEDFYLFKTYLKPLASYLNCSMNDLKYYLSDLRSDDEFWNHIKEKGEKIKKLLETKYIGAPPPSVLEMIYCIIRIVKPQIVVETGVATGYSTAIILKALDDNGVGMLYSIDLPARTFLSSIGVEAEIPAFFKVGYLVPPSLFGLWKLILGDARQELPALVNKLPFIDIFLHDSLHTYEHMSFEYEVVYPKIKEGGLLLSHDVTWNKAFLEFAQRVKRTPLIFYQGDGFGIIRK